MQSTNVYWPMQTFSVSNNAQATTATMTELQSSTIYGSSEALQTISINNVNTEATQSSKSYESTQAMTTPSINFCLSDCTSICNTIFSSKIQKQSTISYASIKQVMPSTESYGTSESTQQSSVSYGSTKAISF